MWIKSPSKFNLAAYRNCRVNAQEEIESKIRNKKVPINCGDWISRSSVSYCNVIVTVADDKDNNRNDHYPLGMIRQGSLDGLAIAKAIKDRIDEFCIHA